MRLQNRLQRLEKKLRSMKQACPTFVLGITEEERVQIVRAVLGRLQIPDPFPDLEGGSYLEKVFDWLRTTPLQKPFAELANESHDAADRANGDTPSAEPDPWAELKLLEKPAGWP
jgi:hypothetical protein